MRTLPLVLLLLGTAPAMAMTAEDEVEQSGLRVGCDLWAIGSRPAGYSRDVAWTIRGEYRAVYAQLDGERTHFALNGHASGFLRLILPLSDGLYLKPGVGWVATDIYQGAAVQGWSYGAVGEWVVASPLRLIGAWEQDLTSAPMQVWRAGAEWQFDGWGLRAGYRQFQRNMSIIGGPEIGVGLSF